MGDKVINQSIASKNFNKRNVINDETLTNFFLNEAISCNNITITL